MIVLFHMVVRVIIELSTQKMIRNVREIVRDVIMALEESQKER